VPTGTNRSIGLIVIHPTLVARRKTSDEKPVARSDKPRQAQPLDPGCVAKTLFSSVLMSSGLGSLLGLVVMARGKTPDPIPNSAVKTLSADGTAA
jgi:hypothetical protein